MNRNLADRIYTCLPWLSGLLAFLLVVGPRALDPSNLAWLKGNDPATQYLGWMFFRQSEWTLPLGMNPDYGLELSSSITFSDSIPLLAIFFKFFDAWLPQPFQYFGLWLLACFMLQAYFAWKLLGLVTDSKVLRILACLLFVFSPPMLWRLAGHWSLVGHFLILAALYLALRPDLRGRRRYWAVLLTVVALVHAYLLAMIGLIWLADMADRTLRRNYSLKTVLLEGAGTMLLLAFACWQAGYFAIAQVQNDGQLYGYFQANLLTLVDPSNWSYLFRDLPEGQGDYEGFNYLGLGVMLLAVMSLPLLPTPAARIQESVMKHRFLLLALFCLGAFALTNKLALGKLEFSIPLPDFFLQAAETFRSSGRMLWPLFYALVFLIVFLIVTRCSYRTAVVLLTLAVVVQVADTRAGWSKRRDALMVARQEFLVQAPTAPFWEQAALRYDSIRVLPPANRPNYWLEIAAFAGSKGMGTNAVYMARIDQEKMALARMQAEAMIDSGDYDSNTLFILDAGYSDRVEASLHKDTDKVLKTRGLLLVAPDWFVQ